MDQRVETRREVLLDVCNEPVTSIDAFVEQCHHYGKELVIASAAAAEAAALEVLQILFTDRL